MASLLIGLFNIAHLPSAAAEVNDFKIQDYQIDFYLDRDAAKASTLKTVEQITAVFPNNDQNHGIERSIPLLYDDHLTQTKLVSVTDKAGKKLTHTTRKQNNNLIVRIGDADIYVHGQQDYVITYTSKDVTRYFKDTNRDEFYWDTNGTEWAVIIQSLTARVHVADRLKNQLTSQQSCYVGYQNSTNPCPIIQTNSIFSSSVKTLLPKENMTLAIGFEPGTFAIRTPDLTGRLSSLYAIIKPILPIYIAATNIVGITALIYLNQQYKKRSNRISERRLIIPEYVPPKNTSVTVAASIYGVNSKTFSAQLIDLAVRKYIKIYQTAAKTLYENAKYELEIIQDISVLRAEEQEILRDIFNSTQVGSRLDLSSLQYNYQAAGNLSDNVEKTDASIAGIYGLRQSDPVQTSWFKKRGIVMIILSIPLLSPVLLLAGYLCSSGSRNLRPLTDSGLSLWHYLEGLKMYITVAETDRIKMLQAPDTAERIGRAIDVNSSADLIFLYERVLPYAILFGIEKEWSKQLDQYYSTVQQSPDWITSSNSAFGTFAFSSLIDDFSYTTTYSNSTSSADGGSSGSGSSGGGGGGGGGGW